MKRKILFCSEFTQCYSGFGKYCNEVISRLHNTGKFHIAEFAQYGNIEDTRALNIPWKFYGNEVNSNHPLFQEYMSKPTNQFGEWRFEKVVLDFKPDIVCCVKDFWMDEHIFQSPLRPYFHMVWMPTCDSAPLQEQWIENIIDADAIFAYNDWSLEVMRKESGGKANIQCSAPPGIDKDIFSPCDNKMTQKEKMMFLPDINLIGMVSRNQVRKLYPDLFIAFEEFLNICKREENRELAKKTYLFLHTSYPDGNCWDLPVLLKERPISHKVLFSYVCKNCKKWFPSLYSSAICMCPFCESISAVLPNVAIGVEDKQLAEIYKCLDIYVQYSNCEGFGLGSMEAASCGVHNMGVDYSATQDILSKTGGTPLKIDRMFRDIGTKALRAYPDNKSAAQCFYNYLTSTEENKKLKENKAIQGVLDNYLWDKTAKIWEKYCEECELVGLQGKWNSKIRLLNAPQVDINNMSNYEFTQYILGILGKTENIHKMRTLRFLSSLNYGAEVDGRKITQLNREDILKHSLKIIENSNICEMIRCGHRTLKQEDFLEFANVVR